MSIWARYLQRAVEGFVGYADQIEFWDLDPRQWVEAACRFAGRNLTKEEWERHGPKDRKSVV